jgi:RND family efflux transporter MFP subunit
MGYLREVRAMAGDTVKVGQVVAVVDAKEMETSVRQAQAGLAEARSMLPEIDNAIAAAKAQLGLAESTYKRMKPLFDDKSITPQEFDEVSAKRDMARANLAMVQSKHRQLDSRIQQATEAVEQAETQKSYLTIIAPFNGIVVERKAEPGMLASPGQPILIVEQAGGYRLEAAIEEGRLKDIRPGSKAKVLIDALGKVIDTRISEIVPALEPGSRTFTAKLDLPATPLIRSGMFGRAVFALGEKKALTIPESAVRREGQVEQVYVIDQGTVHARLITTGARTAGRVEILSGLSAGETVAEAAGGLFDGAKVEVRR